mgnify:CR=1 FL=1
MVDATNSEDCTLSIPFEILCGLVWGYVAASLTESFFHRHVLHANARFRRLWKRYPTFFAGDRSAYYSHHVIHHVRTYRHSFVNQFPNDTEQVKVDNSLPEGYRRWIIAEKYGTTLTFIGVLRFVSPSPPVILFTCLLFGWWVTLGMLVPFWLILPSMSKFVHPFLHRRYQEALADSPTLLAWFMRTRYMRFLIRHHYLHHRYIKCNYNLLLGGDFILGVQRAPSTEDLKAMEALGLPLD